jgi:chromatin remodeling complex protein RSC6
MVRTSKSTTTPAVSAPVSVPVSASVKVEVAAKAPRTKKVAAPKVEVAETPAVDAAVPAAAAVTDASALPLKMNEYSAKLQQLVGLLSTLKNDFRTLEKVVSREMKAAQKASSKKRRNNGNRKPSGFVKPTRITDELALFLGKAVGTEMARTDVSKELNAYIQTHGLQDKANGRKINPDPKLAKLLKISKEDELTYFNLQRFMKHHFIKAEVVPVATA